MAGTLTEIIADYGRKAFASHLQAAHGDVIAASAGARNDLDAALSTLRRHGVEAITVDAMRETMADHEETG